MPDVQRADERHRRSAIVLLVTVLIGGAVLLNQVEAWLEEVRRLPGAAARILLIDALNWCKGLGTFAIALAGAYCWWWGRRVRVSLRFPLPGARVLRDTVILSGQPAASRGLLLQVLGVLLMLSAAGVVILLRWILRTLGGV